MEEVKVTKIEIGFKNGEMAHYKSYEFDDYVYDGKMFIVVKDGKWIGFYNIDEIMYVEVYDE